MKEYNLHSHGDNWFHFRSNQNSSMESFSVTYCHDGTVCMHGDYGCLAWQREWFPEHFDYGFPAELTGIDYFASKVVRASESQKIKEWTQENAIKDIEVMLKRWVEDGDDTNAEFKFLQTMLNNLKSVEYGEHEFINEVMDEDIDTEMWCDIGVDYTDIFKFKFNCLKLASDQILKELNTSKMRQ